MSNELYDAVDAAVADIRAIQALHGISGESLHAIKVRLARLAARGDLFNAGTFPPPSPTGMPNNFMYLLHGGGDEQPALYLNSASGRPYETPVHNHKTWAVIVGVEGEELNRIYEHTPDNRVREIERITVRPEDGVAFLGEDLHAIRVDVPLLHFHLYGCALECQQGRQYYDAETSAWVLFAAHPHIIESRRPA